MKLILAVTLALYTIMAMLKGEFKNSIKPKFYPEYVNEWAEIEQLIDKGLTEDALFKIEVLNTKALNEKNHPQVYKSLIYLERFTAQKDELQIQGIIKRLEVKISRLSEPSKSLIQSVVGTLYFNLSSNNRYTSQKTPIQGQEQDSSDLMTWSNQKLIAKSNELILNSIEYDGLKSESTLDYHNILNDTANINLCRSLYDLLLSRAIEHFGNPTTALNDFNVSISLEKQFSPINEFLRLDLKQNRILGLYQEWLKYLTQSNNDKALITSNLKRLSYVVQANPTKEANILYINALQKYYEDNKKSSSADLIILQ
ncbi:MAG: hypothetical protein ABIO44_11795, partial [Saprospiraceae bacterium]